MKDILHSWLIHILQTVTLATYSNKLLSII